MTEAPRISCIVHTRDSERTLERALASVAWADELLVVDMQSRDRSREIAARYATRLLEAPLVPRVDAIRNRYLEQAAHEWILVLDSDEYLADDAQDNVRGLVREAADEIDAFAIPRFNSIAGQILRGSGWYPDHQLRLFRRGTVQWSDATHVAPRLLTGRGRRRVLEPPGCLHLHHENYADLAHFVRKQLAYAVDDRYDDDPSRFRFEDYLERAYRELAVRRDPERDGDLSRALSLLMAWDAVVRGLLHWDRLRPRPPLPDAVALPPVERGRDRSGLRGLLRRLRRRRRRREPR
jgi:glycosyltransferase involved in cell wall biosynthesis